MKKLFPLITICIAVLAVFAAGCTSPQNDDLVPPVFPVVTTVTPSSTCGFTSCHGLNLACGPNPPEDLHCDLPDWRQVPSVCLLQQYRWHLQSGYDPPVQQLQELHREMRRGRSGRDTLLRREVLKKFTNFRIPGLEIIGKNLQDKLFFFVTPSGQSAIEKKDSDMESKRQRITSQPPLTSLMEEKSGHYYHQIFIVHRLIWSR